MSQEQDNNVANKEVVISPEDCQAALDFWRHFNIPIDPKLQEAMDEFAKNPSYDNQEKVKLFVTHALAATKHEAFQDEMFTKIVEECSGVNFEMQFDKDFEAEVTEKE